MNFILLFSQIGHLGVIKALYLIHTITNLSNAPKCQLWPFKGWRG